MEAPTRTRYRRRPGKTAGPRPSKEVRVGDKRTLGEIFGGRIAAVQRLREETGAGLAALRAAMEDAGDDVDEARRLLWEGAQAPTPEKRRAARAKEIEELKESKPEWRRGNEEQCRKKMAEIDGRIAELEEEQRKDA